MKSSSSSLRVFSTYSDNQPVVLIQVYDRKLCRLDWLLQSMESSSSSSSSSPHWDYLGLLILRPVLAILFVISFISIGWFLAWKLVLVHVPLVQEIFGLRKKPANPKPPTRRISRIYDTIDARNSTPAGINSSGLAAD